ncbi:nuclear GTP-binding protein NUG1 [Physcia stellaris]|nr:nuclear GTP-binding protein NUG1 [Physcia stellaris]
MPPRKSNVSAVSATGDEGTPVKEKEREGINVEDLALPRTMVQRLAKGVLPSNTRIDKDAIAAMSKSATVFVNYLSNGANDRTQTTNRKTISPENVLEALADLELAAFLPRVEAELRRFNEIQTGKRNEYRRKLKEGNDGGRSGSGKGRKSTGGENGLEDDDEVGGHGGGEGEEERAAKRLRGNGEVGRGDGGRGFDAIEAVDAAIRAEEEEEEDEGEQGEGEEDMEGEEEDEDDEDDSHDEDSDPERWSPDPMAEKMDIADANIEGMSSRRERNITDDSDEDDTD